MTRTPNDDESPTGSSGDGTTRLQETPFMTEPPEAVRTPFPETRR